MKRDSIETKAGSADRRGGRLSFGASSWTRRRWLAGTAALGVGAPAGAGGAQREVLTLSTFGDSVLDCGHYNDRGITPGQLLVRNDDALFPEFKGRDLVSRRPARLDHRAVDGATVADLGRQLGGMRRNADEPGIAIVSVGGNDLLRGLAADSGKGLRGFETALERFLVALPVRPVLLANVYDPTFGDDGRNFLNVDAGIARANHRRLNAVVGAAAARHGRLVDLHAHFLRGDPSWFTRTIEPSLIGASEIRRALLAELPT